MQPTSSEIKSQPQLIIPKPPMIWKEPKRKSNSLDGIPKPSCSLAASSSTTKERTDYSASNKRGEQK